METKAIIGRKVILTPEWPLHRHAILLSIDEHGYWFKITRLDTRGHNFSGTAWKVGQNVFYSHGYELSFILVEE